MRVAVAIGLAVALGSAVAAAPTWRVYNNTKYAYATCLPPGMRGGGEMDAGDGQTFRSPDGATLIVAGGYYPDSGPLRAYTTGQTRDLRGPGASVAYQRFGAGWSVTSGRVSSSIVYVKVVQRDDRFVSFRLSYPAALQSRYDPVAARLNKCFTVLPPPFQ